MPYIPEKDRDECFPARNAGELNFCFTTDITTYIETHGLSYQTINDILGALEGAKMEFNRRVVGPYEDKAIERNGDVY